MYRIGVLSPADIAYRRFVPALAKCKNAILQGVAIGTVEERAKGCKTKKYYSKDGVAESIEKRDRILGLYGGRAYNSYEEMLRSDDIDAVYIPLPPALHYKWGKKALENNKHVLMEKPACIEYDQTKELIDIARRRNLALRENYMFLFHEQIRAIDRIICDGALGDIRLFRISFGFPKRSATDFRYNAALGGGALNDAGGYTIKYATYLLKNKPEVVGATLGYTKDAEVDIFGSGEMRNESGVTAQLSFGMDNAYMCELEVWGSEAILRTNRVLTAPEGFVPTYEITKANETEYGVLPADDAFYRSIVSFIESIGSAEVRESKYEDIMQQALAVETFRKIARGSK